MRSVVPRAPSAPGKVVETGVARGITTRFVLEAFERNGSGHLWSIDLPPPLEPEVHGQIAEALPEDIRDRWTYIRGSSRRRLGPLLAGIEPIELFVHESAHTARNVLFELDRVWRALSAGRCCRSRRRRPQLRSPRLSRGAPDRSDVVCHAEPLRPDLPRQDERGVLPSCVSPSFYLRISPNQDPLRARVKRVLSCGNIPLGEQHN